MTDKNATTVPATDRSESVSAEEIAVYRQLKPLIAHCLTLNHELNNPLAGILGYAEFMLDEGSVNLTVDQKRQLQQILKSAERIQKSVQKLSEAKMKLDGDLDLAALIERYQKAAADSD